MHFLWGLQCLCLLAPFSHHAGELMAPVLNSSWALSSPSSCYSLKFVSFYLFFFFKAFFQGPDDFLVAKFSSLFLISTLSQGLPH